MTVLSEQSAASRLKAGLRTEAATRRKHAWQRSARQASVAVAARALAFAEGVRLQAGAAICGYYPINDELDCLPLLSALRAQGFLIGLPKTARPLSLTFLAWDDATPLVPARFGLKEPGPTAIEVTPALVFVPLLAFDRFGTRLGYGAGYYDAGLASLRCRGEFIAIGLGFDEQEFPRLPREPHDVLLDMIITPTRTLRAGDG